MNKIFIFLIVLIIQSCTLKENKVSSKSKIIPYKGKQSVNKISKFTYKIIKLENGFKYVILSNKTPIIEQPIIPAIPGNRPIPSEECAKAFAEIVITKLKKNIFPPNISVKEADSLFNLFKK